MAKKQQTHWVSLFFDRNTTAYFDSFEVEHIPQEGLSETRINLSHTVSLEKRLMTLLCVDFMVSLS